MRPIAQPRLKSCCHILYNQRPQGAITSGSKTLDALGELQHEWHLTRELAYCFESYISLSTSITLHHGILEGLRAGIEH